MSDSRLKFALSLQGGVCIYCDKPLTVKEATRDHIIPRAKGGRTEDGNIAAACFECNSKKGKRDARKFMLARRSQLLAQGAGNGQ